MTPNELRERKWEGDDYWKNIYAALDMLSDLWEAADKMANPNTADAETVEALYQYSEALRKLEEL